MAGQTRRRQREQATPQPRADHETCDPAEGRTGTRHGAGHRGDVPLFPIDEAVERIKDGTIERVT